MLKEPVINAVLIPLASLSNSVLVASGVTSRAVNPVPPVVISKSTFKSSLKCLIASLKNLIKNLSS